MITTSHRGVADPARPADQSRLAGLREAAMGSSTKSPSSLAPFACNWVGGDIRGLSAYAGTLYGYAPKISDVATALNGKVRATVGAAGWQGSAATAFTGAWSRDAQGCAALSTMTTSTGEVVNWLAVRFRRSRARWRRRRTRPRRTACRSARTANPPRRASPTPPRRAGDPPTRRSGTRPCTLRSPHATRRLRNCRRSSTGLPVRLEAR